MKGCDSYKMSKKSFKAILRILKKNFKVEKDDRSESDASSNHEKQQ
jgi:hypothetical protein